jgi:hypothetical protein
LLPASKWLACTTSRAGLAGAASRGRRRPGSSTEANNGEPPTIMTARVGRLELHYGPLLRTRSGGCRWKDLRIPRTAGGRSCPLLSVVDRSAADPARTERGSGPVWSRTPLALRSSATRDRSAGRARQGRCRCRAEQRAACRSPVADVVKTTLQ